MKCIYSIVFLLLLASVPMGSKAQAAELAQLALNIEKLTQFKQILEQMYKGYKVLTEGYNKVKDVTSGNYKLHQAFLDGLYLVSPEVRKYQRIPDIISYQIDILDEYKAAFRHFKNSGAFSESNLTYLDAVYSNLFQRSLNNLEELTMVITSNQLRMSDEERLSAIDRIYVEMKQKRTFLRQFNEEAKLLYLQKKKEKVEIDNLNGLYNFKN
ncbi:TerB family tellurite resistance protein [Chitinophaga sp. Ak27]|uniref:TerB family tellurite resistance protein n=1 Tax=Chitinophaga sp. Ak27 TaxID=2726116 RepID=UPI00145E6D3F|nr:TerB family tellurite resistance protein [Chitinophaga sp. Ak27]NLU91380.1 TerB family tellurite resistance protein [Chitinophaga sp. Ak27]